MNQAILNIGLSISVLSNCYSLWRLLKALKQNDNLSARVDLLEWDNIRRKYGAGIPSMAENTEVAE